MKKILEWTILFLAALIISANPAQSREPVKIFTDIDKVKFVGGQNTVLKVDIVFYQQVNPFWEELAKINFSPFKLEKFILSERKIFDREKDLSRDFRRATFLLSLPDSSDYGLYIIPSFSLNYSYFKDKSEIRGKAKSKTIKAEKVPIIINYDLEKDVMALGESNAFRLIIQREKHIRVLNYDLESAKNTADISKEDFRRWLKSLETRNKKITDLDKPAFGKFKLLSLLKKSESGNIQKEIFEYLFSFYESPIETPTPDFHIWYMNEKEKEQPKEIVISPRSVLVNSAINLKRRSIEWLKEPKHPSGKNIYYFGYAPLAAGGILLIAFATFTIPGLIGNRKKSDTPTETCGLNWSDFDTKSNLDDYETPITPKQARNQLVEALGSILGISADQARAKTALEISNDFRKNGFPENLSQEIQFCFLKMDKYIQSQNVNPLTQCEIKDHIRKLKDMKIPEIAKALQKKKKV